jgi:FkbM family methyltransferase
MLEWEGLTHRSIVLDIGAFDGTWASQVAAKYRPARMFLFEPQTTGAHLDRLHTAMAAAQYPNYQLLPYGLSDCNTVLPMLEANTDGATFVKSVSQADPSRTEQTHGTLIDAHPWLQGFQEAGGWADIDLTSMNIEGMEFDLLPYLIRTGDITLFADLAVQFHLFVDGAVDKYHQIARHLSVTHDLLWEAFPTWVVFRRKTP